MCPFCMASAALMAGSLMSTGGLTALTVKLRAEAVAKKFISEPKPKEDGSWPLAETAENAEKERKMKSKLDLDKSKNGRKRETRNMETKPTYEQAQLHLQTYDLRREARLRQGRDWFFKNYFVENLEDAMRIAGPGTETGALSMMVFSYWEQACALLNYGLLHEDLFFETSGEFFMVWERVKPIVRQARERFVNKQFLGHLEKAAQRYETWMESRSPGHIAGMHEFMKQMRGQLATAAKA